MTDWANQHAYHPATAETAPKHDAIRQGCIDLAWLIDMKVPEGFERDEAQKALQLVRMWANAGIAIRLAPPATEEQRAVPNDPHGQDIGGSSMICNHCGDEVALTYMAVNGSYNPHWGGNHVGYTCQEKGTAA